MVVVKLVHGAVIHRFRADSLTFASLHQYACTAFPALGGGFTFQYVDDEGESVTVANEGDLKEAAAFVATASLPSLKLNIVACAASCMSPAAALPALQPGAVEPTCDVSATAAPLPQLPAVPSGIFGDTNVPVVATVDFAFLAAAVVAGNSDVVCAAGKPFTHSWTLRNTGAVAWPVGVRFVHIAASTFDASACSVAVSADAVAPGESVTIPLSFTAPAAPGKHATYWRLVTSSGVRFGDRAYVTVVVPDALHSVPEGEVPIVPVSAPFAACDIPAVLPSIPAVLPNVPMPLPVPVHAPATPDAEDYVLVRENDIAPTAVTAPTAVAPPQNLQDFVSGGVHVETPTAVLSEEARWEHSMQQLRDMGFADGAENSYALQSSGGDLDQAIVMLLSSAR